jgi:hypothetical protein
MAQSELEVLTESVRGLTGEITALRAETQELHDYGRENRLLIRRQKRSGRRQWAIIVIGIAVTIFAVHTANVAGRAATAAQRNAVNAEQVCEKGNEARATTRALWEGLFKLPSIPALSPAEQAARDAQVATVRARIAVSYADQDCKKLGPQAGK